MARVDPGKSGLPGGTSGLGFFRQLPPAKSRAATGPVGMGGRIIVRHNIHIARKDARGIRESVPPNLLETAERRAGRIQSTIRRQMAAEYRKGTGRAARGVYAKVARSRNGDKQSVVIRITSLNYREMRFLSNIGGSGYFKSGYPIPEYRIWAKGAREQFEDIDPFKGTATINRSKARFLQARRDKGVGRLKIPKEGTFYEGKRGRGGVESRQIRGIPGDLTMENVQTVSQFFYPMWVDHPGFRRDIISEVALKEGAEYISEVQGVVKATLRSGKVVTQVDRTMSVSREIPLHTITISNAQFRRGDRSSRAYISKDDLSVIKSIKG